MRQGSSWLVWHSFTARVMVLFELSMLQLNYPAVYRKKRNNHGE